VADQGEGPDLPLFLDQTEARSVEKNVFETAAPLSQGLDDRAPLSEGLDPPLFMPFVYFTHHFELKVYGHLATKPIRHQEVNSPPTKLRARSLIATK